MTKSQTVLPPLGAHVSIAGGVSTAPPRARAIGATAFQLFLKSSNRWEGVPLTDEEAERFLRETAASGLAAPPVAHSCYLINLASPDETLGEKSAAALTDELERAERLGVMGVILHPGSHKGEGEAAGIARVAERINRIFERLPVGTAQIILETTAGMGQGIGSRFEHLAEIIARVEDRARLGVCLDTCHVFAAGYEMRTAEGVAATLAAFDAAVGLGRLRAIHTNDSKMAFDSRRDRHAHIGEGQIGEAGFAALLRDPRLRRVPFILETPKDDETESDIRNLETLRRLAGG